MAGQSVNSVHSVGLLTPRTWPSLTLSRSPLVSRANYVRSGTMRIADYLLSVCLVGGMAFSFVGRAQDPIEAGPLWHEFALTLAPGKRAEVLGPIISYEQRESREEWRWTPLFSYGRDEAAETTDFDFFYPFLTYDRFGLEYRFQVFQVFSIAGGQSVTGADKKRVTLFPFYFQQRSSDPSQEYTAFLPFFGTLKNRLFRDRTHFVMWPLYAQTQKKDVVTDNYVVPFFHLRHGDGLKGWQFWPLVGAEHKDVTTRTNGFGEVETVGGHRKFFTLWPFYFNNDLGLGTDNPQTQRVLLPFYSIQRSPLRDSATYLFPLELTLTDDREKKYHEVGAPWPFVVFARGEGKTVNRFWPLFGEARSPTLESDFYLWPLYKDNRVTSEPLERQRKRVFLFLYSDLTEKNTATGQALRRTDLWPLFTARRDLEGNERLQLFAPLEPLVPNNKSFERNYSPVWSVWRTEKNKQTGAASESLLWNFYRAEATPETKMKKCSLFFGLVKYESGPGGSRWRLFQVPKGKTNHVAAPEVKRRVVAEKINHR